MLLDKGLGIWGLGYRNGGAPWSIVDNTSVDAATIGYDHFSMGPEVGDPYVPLRSVHSRRGDLAKEPCSFPKP